MTDKDTGPMSKSERLKAWQKDYEKLGFSKFLCGDEAIVTVTPDDKIMVRIRKQTSSDSSRNYILTFDTQSQMERLFPAVMKGLI